jgi:iron complex transport system substrate-binding protein
MKMKSITKILALLLSAVMLIAVVSCGEPAPAVDTSKDREGNPITLPAKIEKIISFGASNTEVLVALGCGEKIIATDTYSVNIEGLKADIPALEQMTPDGEQIINLQPDVIFVSSMSKSDGTDPLKLVADTGVCVIYIPSSASIEAIKEDIRFMAAVTGTEKKGAEIISAFEKDIADIKKIGDTITEKKSVYFEISAAPYMYTAGKPTFINEMIELIGATNAFGDMTEAWASVADEAVLAANPDVILTTVNYIDNPVDEIKARPGWEAIPAVANSEVYYIDTDSSNRPSHNIVKALKEMAKAIYPDKYN